MMDVNTFKDIVVLYCIFPEFCGVSEESEYYIVKVNLVVKVKWKLGD